MIQLVPCETLNIVIINTGQSRAFPLLVSLDRASSASASVRGLPFVSRNRKFSDLRAQTKLWLEPETKGAYSILIDLHLVPMPGYAQVVFLLSRFCVSVCSIYCFPQPPKTSLPVDEPSLPIPAILNPDMEPAILSTSIMEKGSYPIQ